MPLLACACPSFCPILHPLPIQRTAERGIPEEEMPMKGNVKTICAMLILLLVAALSTILGPMGRPSAAQAQARKLVPNSVWNVGDVFLGVSNGQYQVRAPDGTLKEIINDGLTGFTTGCAFDTNGSL